MIGPGDILPNAAKKFADKIALVCGSESFTFGELNRIGNNMCS